MSNIHSDFEEASSNLSDTIDQENNIITKENIVFQTKSNQNDSIDEELSEAIMQEVIKENSFIDSPEATLNTDSLGMPSEEHHDYIQPETDFLDQAIKASSIPAWALENNKEENDLSPREFSTSSKTEFYNPDSIEASLLEQADTSDTILDISLFPIDQVHEVHHVDQSQPTENLQNEALERWLHKPTPEKSDNANTMKAVIGVSSLAITALIGAGVYFSGMFDINNSKVRKFVETGSNTLSHSTVLYDQASEPLNVKTAEASSISSQFDGLTSGGNSSHEVKTTAASFAISPAIGNSITNCKPDIQMNALDGGRSEIKITSECHQNEDVKLTYADVTFVRNLDKQGKVTFILDGFAGNKEPVEILFNDGRHLTKMPVLKDIDNLTKIAVLWTSKHDIDLHAFEYTASQNSSGHLWDRNKSSHTKASEKVKLSGKGHGFISSSHRVTKYPNQKLEVYTFIHAPKQTEAVVKMGLSYKTADESPNLKKANCNPDSSKTLSYQTLQLVRNGSLSRTRGAFVIDSCSPLTQKQIRSNAIQDLEISN